MHAERASESGSDGYGRPRPDDCRKQDENDDRQLVQLIRLAVHTIVIRLNGRFREIQTTTDRVRTRPDYYLHFFLNMLWWFLIDSQ